MIDGLTGDQRFFLAFAQSWRTKMRDAALRARIATDGHAPATWRVETVRNLDAWYDAFGVKPGEKLLPGAEASASTSGDRVTPDDRTPVIVGCGEAVDRPVGAQRRRSIRSG